MNYEVNGHTIPMMWGMRFVELYWKVFAENFVDEQTGSSTLTGEDLLAILLFSGNTAAWKEYGGNRMFKSLQQAYKFIAENCKAVDWVMFETSIVTDFQESMEYKESLQKINAEVEGIKKKSALTK